MVVTISLLLPTELLFPIFSSALLPLPITLICAYKDSLLLFSIFSMAFLPFPITPVHNSVHPPLSPSPLLKFVINWLGQHLDRCFLISCRVYIFQRTSSPSYKLEQDSWSIYYLDQEVVLNRLQESPGLPATCHVTILADIRVVEIPHQDKSL